VFFICGSVFCVLESTDPPLRAMSRWSDVIGLRDAKRAIHEAIMLPKLLPGLCVGIRSPPEGILLYGPPGTGKTLLAQVAAAESGLPLFCVTPSSVLSSMPSCISGGPCRSRGRPACRRHSLPASAPLRTTELFHRGMRGQADLEAR
jgi:hypothetical protein